MFHYDSRQVRFVKFIAFLLMMISLAGYLPAQQTRPATKKEIWAESLIAGNRTGAYHEAFWVGEDQKINTFQENDLIFNRMGSKVEIKSASRYEETGSGRLLSIKSVMSSSAQPTTMEVKVEGNSLIVQTSTGDKTYERSIPFSGDLLGPEAARRLLISSMKHAGDKVSYQMFYPELGAVTTLTSRLVDIEEIMTDGVPRQALKLEQELAAMPGKTLLWMDAEGWLVRQITPTPFGDIETRRASAEKISGGSTEGAVLPEETFRNTLVTSNIRLPEERLIEKMKIRITHKKPELGWPDFSAENQKVLEMTPDHVVLEIHQISPHQHARRLSAAADHELAPFLRPNALLQSDDATVREIAAKVVGSEPDVYNAARALQKWTNQNMQFDLGVAIASASEAARDRRGTCFAYAILLVAMARAEGIPSRIRMGFVYAGGIWGGHAWVEVKTGDEWIPLDGALYSPGPADAARFSFFTSSLEEGTIAQVGALAKLYGNVEIQVLEYTLHGQRVTVPQNATPFAISGNTYRNPWLRLAIEKPESFRFAQLDAVWPKSTILALEGPEHQEIDIEDHSASLPASGSVNEEELLRKAGITGTPSREKIAGQQRLLISSATQAGAVLARGGDVFVIKATGPDAAGLLKKTAAMMKLESN